MTYLRTCHNCRFAREDCATRASLRESIAGLGITSAKFKCANRAPTYRTGQRVSVSWPVPSEDGYAYEYDPESWPATIIGESGPRFKIVVDDVASDLGTPAKDYLKNQTLYARVSAGKLKPLDEPSRLVCPACEAVPAIGGEISGCWGEPGYRPQRCLKDALSTATREKDQAA